ncbi:MAG: hypothetical protein QNK23_02870 [Crocinitomicaceae bacterium]|nr:hypothetical protein [Crocinitomicaceae bacterium]
MRNLLFILLLAPSIGFAQKGDEGGSSSTSTSSSFDLMYTTWEITTFYGNEYTITFQGDNFSYIASTVRNDDANEGESYDDEDETWVFDGEEIIISFNDDFLLLEGTMNESDNFMQGMLNNENGLSGAWFGKRMD